MKVHVRPDKIQQYLRAKKISQNQLAKKIGISREHFNRIIHGQYIRPSNRVIAGLLHWTKIPFEELFILCPSSDLSSVSENRPLYPSDPSSDHS